MEKKKSVAVCSFVLLLVISAVVIVTKKDERIMLLWHGEEVTEIEETQEVSYVAPEGKYSVTVTAVYETAPDTDEKDAPEAEKVVVVVYEYTNSDIEKGLVIGSSHFTAYDKDGNRLLQYPQKNLFEPGEIGEEGTHTASVAFAFNSDENYIKIGYYNDISSDVPDSFYVKQW